MNASARDWQRLQNILLLLLALSFCLYLPTLLHDTFADDEIYLAYMNRFLREAPWSDLYQLFLKPQNPWEFLPLRDFTYWLDFRIYGDEPNGFHVTNLLWYAASGLAVFWLFRELVFLFRPAWTARASVLSLCGALLFVVHPAHVEVAAWIASRKDLVAGTLAFLSLAVLVRAMRRGWPVREVVFAALLLFAACFGKASAMTGALFLTVLFVVGWNASPEVSRLKKLGYLALFWTLVAIAFLIHLKVGEASGIRIENHPGPFLMLDRASRIFTAQIGILLFPYPLRFYYDVYQFGDWHWLVSAGAALLLVVSLAALLLRRSLWALGVVLTFFPLIVYLQLIPFSTWSLASERFVFVSVAGLALVLVDLFGRLANPVRIGHLMLFIVMSSALVVHFRIAGWDDSSTLLSREYELQPEFHNAIRDQIVFELLPIGRYEDARRLTQRLRRDYAAVALLSLVDTDQAYRKMNDARSNRSGDDPDVVKERFCRHVDNLRSAIRIGYERIQNESDVSYNNILRTLDHQLKFQYGDTKVVCLGDNL